ncbi:MAG: hybrid sensor histidine kinase/response regulator [Deltaproteobacteria bacterium]|nr:MAG: hybrid sensor histidine kinase/response regulator [Deltaproteobacteria bacterium]
MEPKDRPDERPLILIVDDETEHRVLLSRILRRNYRIAEAADGEEALAFATREPVDLTLVDQRMPGMSGIAFLERLKEERPDTIRFLVTAFSDVAVLKEAINRANVYRFVPKPVEPEALRLDIRRAIEHRDTQRMLLRAQKMAVLGRLSASVVHDLRNYLQVIKGTPYFLRRSGDERLERVARRLEEVELAMEDLIEELLAMARGRKPNYRTTEVALSDVVEKIVAQCRNMADFSDRSVVVEIEGEIPTLPLSRNRVERMLQNLLLNAAQATQGGGEIRVRLSRSASDRLELRIIDDGGGIPPEWGERIFDPFFTTKAQGGAGLGLAIARAVAEAHGASLTYESPPGGGTSFVVTFPLSGRETLPSQAEGDPPSE